MWSGIRDSREPAVVVEPAGTQDNLGGLWTTATVGSEMPVMWAGPPSILLVIAGAMVVLGACAYLPLMKCGNRATLSFHNPSTGRKGGKHVAGNFWLLIMFINTLRSGHSD